MADTRSPVLDPKTTRKPGRIPLAIFICVLLGGTIYAGGSLLSDLSPIRSTPGVEFLLLALTLATALGFEFVNGFHDTANAVATVIYTYSLEPHLAVVWSGLWNFIGVLTSSGAVAFGIVSLLVDDAARLRRPGRRPVLDLPPRHLAGRSRLRSLRRVGVLLILKGPAAGIDVSSTNAISTPALPHERTEVLQR